MKIARIFLIAATLAIFLQSGSAMTLKEALQIGIAGNNSVEALASRVTESQRRIRTSQSSYWPRLGLGGSYTYVSRLPKILVELPLPIEFPEIRTGTHNIVETRLTGNYLLFDWGKRRKQVAQSVLAKESSEVAVRKAKESVAYEITKTYAYAALLIEQRKTLENYLATSNKHTAETQSRLDNGLASRFELLKSEIQGKIYEQQLAIVDADLRIALARLRETIGADSLDIEISEALTSITIAEPEMTNRPLKEQIRSKPEIVAILKQQEISNLTIGLEQLRPTVTMFGSTGWKNNYMPDPDKLLFNFSGGVAVNFEFFNGGYSAGRRDEERAKQETLNLEIEKIISETITAIEINREDVMRLSAKYRITQEKLELARKAMEIASVSYNTGTITNADYLDTELEVQQIETESLQDGFNLLIAKLELKRALSYWPELE